MHKFYSRAFCFFLYILICNTVQASDVIKNHGEPITLHPDKKYTSIEPVQPTLEQKDFLFEEAFNEIERQNQMTQSKMKQKKDCNKLLCCCKILCCLYTRCRS